MPELNNNCYVFNQLRIKLPYTLKTGLILNAILSISPYKFNMATANDNAELGSAMRSIVARHLQYFIVTSESLPKHTPEAVTRPMIESKDTYLYLTIPWTTDCGKSGIEQTTVDGIYADAKRSAEEVQKLLLEALPYTPHEVWFDAQTNQATYRPRFIQI